MQLKTARLRLRPWTDADRAPFAAMNADPAVMGFFPAPLSREASDQAVDRWSAEIDERGWSNWAVERLDTRRFIGFVGLSVPRHTMPFSPCVEIGWRLAREHWHHGFATEAALATLRFGFNELRLDEIVSFTALVNERSRRVMERIGMRNTHDDFDHPALAEGHWLRRHCLYKITRSEWNAGRSNTNALEKSSCP